MRKSPLKEKPISEQVPAAAEKDMYSLLPLEKVRLDSLKPHPRNYRSHPDDEIAHLKESILSNGFYRNVVVSRDDFILAGRGVCQAAQELDMEYIPIYRFPFDGNHPRSIKLLVSDNEISHLAMNDDRLLSELLREVKESDMVGLLGTGYDDLMLANLVYVTRPASEIKDLDAAAQWTGMPEYDQGTDRIQLILNFDNEQDRAVCCEHLHLDAGVIAVSKATVTAWWPAREQDDIQAVRFTDRDKGE